MNATTEMETLKAKLKATWTAGDFDKIAQSYAPGAAEFIARLALQPGTRVLDAACGSGNLSFPAADAGAIVTGIDIAPSVLATARARAAATGQNIQFDEGDVEQLPYENESFDVVVSMFGVMFAPRPDVVVAELVRVTRPGGQIALANWTPAGFIGQMFKRTAAHVPPPAGMVSPLLWGDPATVTERLQEQFTALRLTPRMMPFRLDLTPTEVVEYFRQWYGPTQRAFAALDETQQAALRADLEQLWTEHNQATDGTTHVESEYLEVIATRI
ncbi:MAG TPA: class I SAM-dependent methyltransferase [Blastocatellia bacterium]|nr:class I SAM-dependent methyltransferase [Blastocatellia bacterium]